MKPATLPPSARAMAHASTGTQTDFSFGCTPMLEERRKIVDKVCDRAERLSKRAACSPAGRRTSWPIRSTAQPCCGCG